MLHVVRICFCCFKRSNTDELRCVGDVVVIAVVVDVVLICSVVLFVHVRAERSCSACIHTFPLAGAHIKSHQEGSADRQEGFLGEAAIRTPFPHRKPACLH